MGFNCIDQLDGYEFELLITRLLKKMGFIVEPTPLSHDGGIDIIATVNTAILSGKYLVQCKRYSGKVGEPVVRDLYGVVVSQNANKGIIITNSSFSDSAIAFANGKNIELIDGNNLSKLLMQYDVSPNTEQNEPSSFKDFSSFDKDQYVFLENLLNTNKSEYLLYEKLFQFLYSYIESGDEKYINSDIISSCINLLEKTITRFGKRGKNHNEVLGFCNYFLPFLYLINGNILKSTEILTMKGCWKANADFWSHSIVGQNFPEFEPLQYGYPKINANIPYTYLSKEAHSSRPNLYNLYIIFFNNNFIEGIKKIEEAYEEQFYFYKNPYKNTDISKYLSEQSLKYMDKISICDTFHLNQNDFSIEEILEKNYHLYLNSINMIKTKSKTNIYIPQLNRCFLMDKFIEISQVQKLSNESLTKNTNFNQIKYLFNL